MDKNNIIGFILIFIILFAWMRFNAPSPEEIEAQQRAQDSLLLEQRMLDSLAQLPLEPPADTIIQEQENTFSPDSTLQAELNTTYGPFSSAATGTEQSYILENELFKVSFSNKGGWIKEVELKNYSKINLTEEKKEIKIPLKLLEDEKNKFEYLLPVANVPSGSIKTSDLFFEVSQSSNSISFRANAGRGYFEQKYTIKPDSYGIDYELQFVGLDGVLNREADRIKLDWINYLDRLEDNTNYERSYSSIYYKEADDDPSYCDCRSDDVQELNSKVKWVSNSNQFFNSALLAETNFDAAILETHMLDEDAEDLKKLHSQIWIPYNRTDESFKMELYTGPNDFERLVAYGNDFEDVIPFGWSIFGTINRWVIRPLFNFLSGFIGSKGIVILVLTLLVKLALYPLTYKMLHSQSKMGALKPQLAGLKEKFGDDAQKQQMETMKLYREFGVSPFGGCMPMVLQMPIWFALYRFFPASIEFRQASFLWASDLSSYDVFFYLPFELPLNMGAHVSLFTILWAITTLIYTFYNTKHMDMSINPAMKYMQYGMPIMFAGFFNSFASGLTCYLFFSNIMNIGQTIITKNYIIDQEKIKAELEENRKKPKKKSAFQQRLQQALADQQKVQSEREAAKAKGKPKKKGKK